MWVEGIIRTDYRVVIVNRLLPCGVIVTLSHGRIMRRRDQIKLFHDVISLVRFNCDFEIDGYMMAL